MSYSRIQKITCQSTEVKHLTKNKETGFRAFIVYNLRRGDQCAKATLKAKVILGPL